MNNLLVSIILPVFNGEKFISQAIESVLKQSYSNFELIIVNDGSTDNTEIEVKKFNDNRILYIKQQNRGPAAARNKGMSIAKGKYFAFIDADDLYEIDKIQKQVEILNDYRNISVVYNDYTEVNSDFSDRTKIHAEFIFEKKEDLLAMMLFRPVITIPPSIMIRRECYELGYKYNETYIHGEDYDFLINLLQRFEFYHIPEPLYIYRKHENNLTNEHNKQIRAEVRRVKEFTNEEIINIVNNSSFSRYEKDLLIAKIFIKREQYQIASEYLSKCLSVKNDAKVWFYIGNCRYFENNLELAEISYRKSIEVDNKMAEAYNNLGCVYAIQMKSDAVKLFNKALEIRHNYMDPKFNMEQIKSGKFNFKLTTRELRKILTTYKTMNFN